MAPRPSAPTSHAPSGAPGAGVLQRQRDLIPMLVLLSLVASIAVGLVLLRLGADVAALGAGLAALLFLVAVIRLPSNVDAWHDAADPLHQTSLALQPLLRSGFVILRDRRLPGSRQTIEHVAIGPSGAWVIGTEAGGGRLRTAGGDLMVDGRASKVVDHAIRIGSAIETAAAAQQADASAGSPTLGIEVVVRPVLCFHRSRLPRGRWSRREVRGVSITDGRGLQRLLASSPAVLDEDAVQGVTAILDRALPPRGRAAGK